MRLTGSLSILLAILAAGPKWINANVERLSRLIRGLTMLVNTDNTPMSPNYLNHRINGFRDFSTMNNPTTVQKKLTNVSLIKGLSESTATSSEQLIQRFKSIYSRLDNTKAACGKIAGNSQHVLLDEVYSENVIFKDPVHQIEGLTAYRHYMDNMYSNVLSCEFTYHEHWIGENSATIKWDMLFRHRKLGNGKLITVRGMTHVRFSDRIDYHEDVFDVGAMLYEHIPLLGRMLLKIKARLAG